MSKLRALQLSEIEEQHKKNLKKRLTKNSAKVLFGSLQKAVVEKDVENAWRKIFTEYYIDKQDTNDEYQITSPLDVDGFIAASSGNLVFALRILMEFKNGTDLTKAYDRARIICQCIHYMKKFQKNGLELPTVIVGADEDQAFVLVANKFYKYLDGDYNWQVSPSSAYKDDLALMTDLVKDANLSVYPFQFTGGNLNERYNSLLDLFDSIDSISQNDGKEAYKVKVSPATIVGMFDEFNHIAFREPEKVNPVQAVNMFIQMITGKNEEDYYFIPRNRNLYHLPGDKKVSVFGIKIEEYLNHYDRNFTVKEIDKLTSIADRLIEVNERRFKGDFWTPDIWVKEADKIMQEAIDPLYKENSLVWDCAAGVRNLTRQFKYNKLFISTYHNDELLLGDGYNPEAKEVFQYDFLNDDVELTPAETPDKSQWKMPNKLFDSLVKAGEENQRVVFYTNPPYGTANNFRKFGTSKATIAKSKVNSFMKKNNYGKASQQLYAQFIVRVMKLIHDFKLKNVYIAFFTNARFLTGGDYWEKFNNKFFSNFTLIKGNLFSAGEFSDTAETWPITFSVYKYSPTPVKVLRSIKLQLQESIVDDKQEIIIHNLNINDSSTKLMINVKTKDTLNKWVKEPLNLYKHLPKLENVPQLGSAMKISKGVKPSGFLLKGSLGYMVFNSDNVGEGTTNGGVWLVSGSAYKGHGLNVMPKGLDRAVIGFAARRVVTPTWYNAQDNFEAPDLDNKSYKEFVNDALVFSLFDNASNQASYRHATWSNCDTSNKWINQWFWVPKQKVLDEIEDNPSMRTMYSDIRTDDDRIISQELIKRSLSKEAQETVELATMVWKDTLKYRPIMSEDEPELYLNAWDAGWFQIKQVNKRYPSSHFDQFREAFKKLSKKLEINVYRLGMLNK